MNEKYYYGAAARASALIANYPHWMDVTRWPVDDEEWEDELYE